MGMLDRFGLELTTASSPAAEDYVAAVDLMLSATAGAEALLDRVLAADPDFALGHIARARLCQVQARVPEAKAAAAAARALAGRVTPREARHIETVALAVDGNGPGAMALLDEHIAEYPRDAVPLSLALGVFGLLGFSGRIDHHEAQLALLERLAPHWGDDWWFLAYLGWARIELGDIARGTAEVERALAGNPRNAFAAHARAHGYFEAGEPEPGAAFIEAWLPGYDRRSQLHCHLSWHLALFELARGNTGRAWALYADAVRPSVSHAPPLFSLADAASFLWRCHIYETRKTRPVMDGAWSEVARHVRDHFPNAGLHFADVHAIFAEAAIHAASSRMSQIRERLATGKLPRDAVVQDLCVGVALFARGATLGDANALGRAISELPRIGGSHAQREVFEDTYIVACLRSKDEECVKGAGQLLRARLARRPSARDRSWLAEAMGN